MSMKKSMSSWIAYLNCLLIHWPKLVELLIALSGFQKMEIVTVDLFLGICGVAEAVGRDPASADGASPGPTSGSLIEL